MCGSKEGNVELLEKMKERKTVCEFLISYTVQLGSYM